MRTIAPLFLFPLLVACQGNGILEVVDPDATGTTDTSVPTNPNPTGGGACGEITRWDVTVSGRVIKSDGSGASFADVWVEDRGWAPVDTMIGSTTADQAGNFVVDISELVSAEDCWGTILEYVIIGEQGPISGERQINNPLFNAIQDGSLAADIADLTLE